MVVLPYLGFLGLLFCVVVGIPFLNFDIFPFLVCVCSLTHVHISPLKTHVHVPTLIHTHTHSHTMHIHTHIPTLTHVHTLTQCIPMQTSPHSHVTFTSLAFHAQLLHQHIKSPVEQLDIYPLILSSSLLPPPSPPSLTGAQQEVWQ